jgi:hypothetical protein
MFDNHGLNEVVGRDYLVDEYVYFTCTYLNYKISEVENPATSFSGHNPVANDFPGIEGFGGTMLRTLVRTNDRIKNVNNASQFLTIPIIGLTFPQVFDIISTGATTNDQLRTNIQNWLNQNGTAEQAARFPVALQRIGWSYSVKGTLVDEITNSALPGYTVESIYKGEQGIEYTTEDVPGLYKTDNNGNFEYKGSVFPGTSTLRFTKDEKSYDVDINCPYENPTNSVIDLSVIKISLTPYITSYSPDIATINIYNYDFRGDLDVSISGGPFRVVSDELEYDNHKRHISIAVPKVPASEPPVEYQFHVSVSNLTINRTNWNPPETEAAVLEGILSTNNGNVDYPGSGPFEFEIPVSSATINGPSFNFGVAVDCLDNNGLPAGYNASDWVFSVFFYAPE